MEDDKALTRVQPRPLSASVSRDSLIREWVYRFLVNGP